MVAPAELLHLYFLVLEISFWERPLGMKTFGASPEFAKASKTPAANQGLYNGFLAAGLFCAPGIACIYCASIDLDSRGWQLSDNNTKLMLK